MKFSIRLSIATLFVALLLIISTIILSVTYYTMHGMMINHSRDSLQKSSNLINSEINGYLDVFKERTKISSELFTRGVIGFDKQDNLRRYLADLVSNRPNISGAYISSPKGNFYFVEEDDKGELHLKVVLRDQTPPLQIDAVIDKDGHILSSKKTLNTKYDPRVRPFYTAAVKKGSFTWSPIYEFMLTPRGETIWGVAATNPIYDKSGKLEAVFSIDTTIDILTKFMSELRKTKNTFVYMLDNQNHLVTTKYKESGIEKKRTYSSTVYSADELESPWVKQSLKLFQTYKKPFFDFTFDGEKYLANYRSMPNLFGGETLIGIVLPLNDIIGPLKKNIWICVLIGLIVLLIGAVCANYLSSTISRPIVKLADDARAIANMDITQDSKLKSYIKEVIDMRDAYNLMKRALRSFARYVPFDLVQRLIKSGEVAKVGGKNKQITLLFSDIKSFTSISESFAPCDLMEYLSEYFEAMSTAIINTHGTIDKYIGDGIMAFWGAPLADKQHAKHACEGALSMLKALKKTNQKWKSKGKPELTMRIGLNTADVVVGNVGSDDRLSYTALGDGVNLASRLEQLSKTYDTTILVGGSTYQLVKKQFAFRLIDHVTVRGKTIGGPVYELLEKENVFGKKLAAYNASFEQAFALYQKGHWDKALKEFDALQKQYPKDNIASVYLKRIALLKEEQPKKWDGVWQVGR